MLRTELFASRSEIVIHRMMACCARDWDLDTKERIPPRCAFRRAEGV